MTNITFDSNDLQTANILSQAIDHYNAPNKEAPVFALPYSNRSSIPYTNYPSRKIVLSGQLVSDTIANLDALIDTFKGYFNTEEGNLDIDYNGGTRRFIATVTNIAVGRPKGLTYADFSVEFTCPEPFGVDTSNTTITNTTGHTSASLTLTPTIGGTAPQQLPVITITLNAFTGDGDYVQVSNDLNGQSILLYNLGLAEDDVIVIDCVNRSVTVNGTEVDYFGTFLEIELGSASITYADGFDTRDVDINIVYKKRWL